MIDIPLLHMYPHDILLVLCASAGYSILKQTRLYLIERPSTNERNLQQNISSYRSLVQQSRAKGPSAFVETSKLERKLLQYEKSISDLKDLRSNQRDQYTKSNKKLSRAIYILFFILYYAIPLFQIDGLALPLSSTSTSSSTSSSKLENNASTFLRELLFPLQYSGLSIKLAQLSWGIQDSESQALKHFSGLGALVIFWAGELTVELLLENVYGYMLRL